MLTGLSTLTTPFDDSHAVGKMSVTLLTAAPRDRVVDRLEHIAGRDADVRLALQRRSPASVFSPTRHRDRQRLAVAHDTEDGGVARRQLLHGVTEVVGAVDDGAADRDDDVVVADAGLVGRAAGDERR